MKILIYNNDLDVFYTFQAIPHGTKYSKDVVVYQISRWRYWWLQRQLKHQAKLQAYLELLMER